ncbi:hypothetical protein JCM11641_004561 [Rhodosporidiobolus odoratus]
MFAFRPSFLTAALALFATVASAADSDGVYNGDHGVTLIDYQPPFTAPKGGEVWIAGGSYSASWSQKLPSGIDQGNVSQSADLVMGYKVDGSSALHISWVLASDIPLYAPNPNTVDFTLPVDLETKDSYILILLGSTRNQSPEFTIISNPVGAGLSGSSGASPAPATTTPSFSSPNAAYTGTPTNSGGDFRRVRRTRQALKLGAGAQ